jgi:hypothetical protein
MRQTGLKISAVVIGLVVDVGASLLVGGAFGLAMAFWFAGDGVAAASTQLEVVLASPAGLWGSLLIGAACSALGGYVAARLAPHAPRFHGMAVGVASVATGVIAAANGMASGPRWVTVLGAALTIPAALAGSMAVASAEGDAASRLTGASQ